MPTLPLPPHSPLARAIPGNRPEPPAGALNASRQAFTANPTPGGYELRRGGLRIGVVFHVPAGWVSMRAGHWRRSPPAPTAAEAAGERWGQAAAQAIHHEVWGDAP
jgi:hypothetical protein